MQTDRKGVQLEGTVALDEPPVLRLRHLHEAPALWPNRTIAFCTWSPQGGVVTSRSRRWCVAKTRLPMATSDAERCTPEQASRERALLV